MPKTFLEIQSEIADNLGLITLDDTTEPTLSRVKSYINDVCREVMSDFPYSQLQKRTSYPFYHTINHVQGAFLSGATSWGLPITGNVVPYPTDVLSVNGAVVESYVGIGFTGYNPTSGTTFSGTSTSGNTIYGSVQIVGHQYELQPNVDQIYAVTIPSINLKLSYAQPYDFSRYIAQGMSSISGNPICYTQMPGLSASGNTVIEFYPMPDNSFSGNDFVIHAKQKHLNMTEDADIQTVIPENYQDIIIDGALEKCFVQLNDKRASLHSQRKTQRLFALRKWAENQLDNVNQHRDGHYLGNAAVVASSDLAISSMVWGD